MAKIRVKCPECAKVLNVGENLAGKKVRCPNCKSPVRVPAAGGGTSEADQLRPSEPSDASLEALVGLAGSSKSSSEAPKQPPADEQKPAEEPVMLQPEENESAWEDAPIKLETAEEPSQADPARDASATEGEEEAETPILLETDEEAGGERQAGESKIKHAPLPNRLGGEDKKPPRPSEPEEEDEAISLVGDENFTGKEMKFAQQAKLAEKKVEFRRSLNAPGTGATRCKVFYSKIQQTSLEAMEVQVNEWLDANDDVEVKEVGHVIGTMLGKVPEPNLICIIWY
jgi:hypothetical protein